MFFTTTFQNFYGNSSKFWTSLEVSPLIHAVRQVIVFWTCPVDQLPYFENCQEVNLLI